MSIMRPSTRDRKGCPEKLPAPYGTPIAASGQPSGSTYQTVDVAHAGGWSDLTSLKTAYQQPDMTTLYRAVSEPAELREERKP